jgi:hypothetical protein
MFDHCESGYYRLPEIILYTRTFTSYEAFGLYHITISIYTARLAVT